MIRYVKISNAKIRSYLLWPPSLGTACVLSLWSLTTIRKRGPPDNKANCFVNWGLFCIDILVITDLKLTRNGFCQLTQHFALFCPLSLFQWDSHLNIPNVGKANALNQIYISLFRSNGSLSQCIHKSNIEPQSAVILKVQLNHG